MLQDMVGSWWFWISIFIVSWSLNFIFWQKRKEEAKRISNIFAQYHQMYKYPFNNDFWYDIMSVLGFPALLFYLVLFVTIFVVTRLVEPLFWT